MKKILQILLVNALAMAIVTDASGLSQRVATYVCEETERWGDRSGEELFAIGGLAVARDNIVYVTDSFDYSVKKFFAGRGLTGKFGKRGKGPQEFSYPYAIAVHRDTVAVVDVYSQKVQLFLPDGQGVRSLRSTTSPLDVGFDGQGNVWVASVTVSPEERVVAFDRGGNKFRSIITGSDEPRRYLLEAVVLATSSFHDVIVLATVFANRVSVYDSWGTLVTTFSIPDLPDHAEEDQEHGNEILPTKDVIKDITLDQNGNIFVLGGAQSPHRARDVYIMSQSGRLEGHLLLPEPSSLIALDQDGFLYSTSNERTLIKKYRLKRVYGNRQR